MSISITASPQAYTPSDNDIIWQFTSTNSGQQNFSFFVEVYIDGILRGSHIVFPERSNKGKFNAMETARLYCSKPVIPSAWSAGAQNFVSVYLKIWERYGDPAENQGSASTSSTVIAWKARLTDEQWVEYDDATYRMGNGCKFLTFFPRDERMLCGFDEKLFMMYINDGTLNPELQVSLYDSSGGLVNTDTIGLPSGGETIIIFDAGIDQLVAQSTLTQANFEDSEYYTLRVSDGSSILGETFNVYVDTSCDTYSTKRLHFINKLGGMDSWSFTKANTQRREVKSFGFEKSFGRWNSSNVYGYDLADGREQQIIKTSTGTMTISSDWLKEAVQNWLADELYESPFVLLEFPEYLKRVNVLNSQFNIRQTLTDQLFQEVVEINLSDARKSVLV
jgi:hypothetical protein